MTEPLAAASAGHVGADNPVFPLQGSGQDVEVAPVAREAVGAHEGAPAGGRSPLGVRHPMEAVETEAEKTAH
jgi:hypothetical protein